MRYTLLAATALAGLLSGLMASPAHADNSTVENALRDRPDLSVFYNALISTGVINELKEGQSYTVFAPTNDALASLLPANQYPCFYSQGCKAEVAVILRNHIVPGEKHLSEMGNRQGGVMSMFAIDHYHIVGSEPTRNHYAVEGHNVLNENQLIGSVLYRVDGVIANPQEIAELSPRAIIAYEAGTNLPPPSPEGSVVTITHTVGY